MKRPVPRLLAAVLAVLCTFVTPSAHAQQATPSPTKIDQLVELINRARVQAGVMPLARSPELDSAAQGHSADMVQHNYLDHVGWDGTEPQDRADVAGYHVPPRSAWIVVEVISARSADPTGPVDWWLSDSQHARVLLNPRWRELGAGYAQGGDYGNYWTVDVGCRPGVLPTVTLDGVDYAQTEQCGDPNSAVALVTATPSTPTPGVTATPATTATMTLVPSPTALPTPPPAP